MAYAMTKYCLWIWVVVPLIFALLIFVGIPLPGTGAWTGTLAASFLKIDFKTSIAAVTLGVLLAGIIMSLGSKIVSILGWPASTEPVL